MEAEKYNTGERSSGQEFFSAAVIAKLHNVFAKITKKLILKVHIDGSDTAQELLHYARELIRYTDKLSVVTVDCGTGAKPYMELLYQDASPTGISYHGAPRGHIFTPFMVGIYYAGGDDRQVDGRILRQIKALHKAVNMKVFLTPACRLCQDLTNSCQNIAVRNELISAEVYDLTLYPELKERYNIESVPCMVINDCVIRCGKRNIYTLLDDLRRIEKGQACNIRRPEQNLHRLAVEHLLNMYSAVLIVDLVRNTLTEISAFARESTLTEDAQSYLWHYVRYNVAEEYQQRLHDIMQLDMLKKHLMDGNIFETDFVDICLGWLKLICIPIKYNENGEVDAVLLCCRDINNNKSYELELAKKLQSATKDVRRLRKDGLTAVYNRETGQSHIEQEIGQHQKGLFCIIDCDAFKKINDIYGHMAGDAVLVQVANCIKKSLRQSDTIFRLGGDEFVFFARNISSEEMAKLVFERLFRRVNKINAVDLPKHTVRISAGAVLYGGESSTSFEELYQRADKELYLSKKFKGCRVSFAKPIK